jgi:AraC-like DNA-binding protein
MRHVRIDPSNERKIADFRRIGERDVVALGRYAYARAHRPLSRHTHGRMVEICLLDEGVQPVVVGDATYVLKGGDVLVTFPHEVHGTGRSPENRGRLYWLLVRVPRPGGRFLDLPPPEARRLAGALQAVSPRHFRGTRMMKHYLERMFEAHDRGGDFRGVEIRNWALRFLLDALEASRRQRRAGVSPRIRDVQAFVEERLHEPAPRLEALADRAHLSLPAFMARFKRETGVSPGNWIRQRKIERAKALLARAGATVTGVAFGLGFSTSQYFATVFRRYTGQSPGRFRAGGAKGGPPA